MGVLVKCTPSIWSCCWWCEEDEEKASFSCRLGAEMAAPEDVSGEGVEVELFRRSDNEDDAGCADGDVPLLRTGGVGGTSPVIRTRMSRLLHRSLRAVTGPSVKMSS